MDAKVLNGTSDEQGKSDTVKHLNPSLIVVGFNVNITRQR